MTRRDDMNHSPEASKALEALRRQPVPRASNEARQRARAAFMAAEAPAGPTQGQKQQTWWVPLAAAAMLAMAVFGIGQWANGPSALWRVTDVVQADGLTGAPAEGFVMEAGRITTGPETELELQLGNQLRLRLLPGTELELPPPPRRWRPDEMTLTLAAGEVFGIGEGLDAPLLVIARHSETLITGTTFAVFQTEDASCTCLWSGSVDITNRSDGTVYTLQPGKRYYVYADGTTSGPQPLDAMETMKLQMIHDAGLLPDPTDQR